MANGIDYKKLDADELALFLITHSQWNKVEHRSQRIPERFLTLHLERVDIAGTESLHRSFQKLLPSMTNDTVNHGGNRKWEIHASPEDLRRVRSAMNKSVEIAP